MGETIKKEALNLQAFISFVRSRLKGLWSIISHVQVLSVFLAFALMVFLSYNYMSDIERKHLLEKVDNAILNTQEKISVELLEPEATLGIISETIREMIIDGVGHDKIEEYIIDITEYMLSDKRLMSYTTGIYAYFDVFGGKFCDGLKWIPPDDYDPKSRPWYITAVNAAGYIGISEPAIDAFSNEVSISFAREIFNDHGSRLGIICLDIMLERIKGIAINTHVTEDSYGILFDKDFNVLAHPHPAFIGRHLSQMNDGVNIQNMLMRGESISELEVRDYNQNASVAFIQQLNNGWYLAIVAYSDKYYKSVTNIGYMLTALGAVLAIILSAFLISLITAKKKADERIKIMLDSTPLCANFWNKDFKIIDCNQEALNLFGLSSKKEYLDSFYELSPEYQSDGRLSREKALENLEKAFKEGYYRFDWTHRKLNGELIPCEITLVRVNYRNEFMICGYSSDLRELKKVMEKFREADECTQVLFNTTPLSSFMVDKNFKVLESNQEIVRLFGLKDKKEFIDHTYDFFPKYQPTGEESSEKVKKYLNEAFEEGFCRFDWMHQKLDGEQIPTEVSLVRVKFRGEYAIAGYIIDLRELNKMIAEMHRAEIAEESNKAKSDFLAKMSHEIRTPMNAIMGITEIQLQDNILPLATKEALERIYNSGDLLLGIINDILDLSKIEAGKLELNSTQYEIASLIYDTVKLNVMRYESKPIEFRLDVNANTPTALIGDELRIKQILNNLLSNAYKYTYEGQIEFSLSAEYTEDKTSCFLVFRVSDTGQGMTADQVKKLGDKFSRFNLDANRKTEGTGLGMNITRNLIQLMNGDISVESTPGLGSVFTVRLPQSFANSDPIGIELAENLMKLNLKSTTKMRNAQITQDYMPYGRVLVIDDVETNLYVARGLIAPYGISIDTGLSGFEAIDKIRGGTKYDIIFMDHMMPRMDGIETVKIIRSLGYTESIVALTANALSGQAEMFLNNGFDDFISKPIDIRQLNNILNKLIRNKQPQEVLEEARRQKHMLYAAGGHNIVIDPQLAEFFIRDAKKTINVLSAISRNNCRRLDDIPTLIINVHAMKSALANVGEKDLSTEASKLEFECREKNINLIMSSLPKFIESLKEVIEKLQPSDDDSSEEKNDIDANDMAFLHQKLISIKSACSTYNKKLAKDALAELKQKTWPRFMRDQLSAIAKHLLHSEFDETTDIVNSIIKNEEKKIKNEE